MYLCLIIALGRILPVFQNPTFQKSASFIKCMHHLTAIFRNQIKSSCFSHCHCCTCLALIAHLAFATFGRHSNGRGCFLNLFPSSCKATLENIFCIFAREHTHGRILPSQVIQKLHFPARQRMPSSFASNSGQSSPVSSGKEIRFLFFIF